MTREIVTAAQKIDALLRMHAEDGATAAGEFPPVEHVAALADADRAGQPEQVRAAHAEGRGPPDLAAAGDAGPPDSAGRSD